MLRSFIVLQLLLLVSPAYGADKCPPIFGEFECPLNYNCVDSTCASSDGIAAPWECDKVTCPESKRCFKVSSFF